MDMFLWKLKILLPLVLHPKKSMMDVNFKEICKILNKLQIQEKIST